MKNRLKHIAVLLLIIVAFFGCKGVNEKKEDENNKEHISTLSPMKNGFADKFMFGNIFNPSDVSSSAVTNTALTRHYNVLTAENNMKPDQISTGKGSYNFTTADRMVNAAIASGFKVVGHTLLWHSQIPQWQQNISSATALEDMKQYITDVVGHFKGKIYSWDVLNEAFPDGGNYSSWKTSMRTNNPWFKAIGSDFV
jgi:endo-1,4-beta-xylanase